MSTVGAPSPYRIRQVLHFLLDRLDMQQQAQATPDESMTAFLRGLVRQGTVKAHRLDSRLATKFRLSLSKATAVRRSLGFLPAYNGGPVVAPKEV